MTEKIDPIDPVVVKYEGPSATEIRIRLTRPTSSFDAEQMRYALSQVMLRSFGNPRIIEALAKAADYATHGRGA